MPSLTSLIHCFGWNRTEEPQQASVTDVFTQPSASHPLMVETGSMSYSQLLAQRNAETMRQLSGTALGRQIFFSEEMYMVPNVVHQLEPLDISFLRGFNAVYKKNKKEVWPEWLG